MGISTETPLSWYPRLNESVNSEVSVALYQADRTTPLIDLDTVTLPPSSPARNLPAFTSIQRSASVMFNRPFANPGQYPFPDLSPKGFPGSRFLTALPLNPARNRPFRIGRVISASTP